MISIYSHSTGRFYTNAIGDSDTEEFKALIYIWIGKTLAKLGKIVLSPKNDKSLHRTKNTYFTTLSTSSVALSGQLREGKLGQVVTGMKCQNSSF